MGNRRQFGIHLIISLAFGTALISGGAAQAETTFERVKREGKVKVGIYNGVPTGYVTKDGKLTGESPEVLREALKYVADGKIQMEAFVADDFGALIPGLLAGRFDIITAGLYVTAPRCKTIAYTNPTIKYGEGLVVKKGNPLKLHSLDDIVKHPTARLGAAPGSQEQKYAEAAGIKGDRLRLLQVSQVGLAAVRSGQVDALLAPAVEQQALVKGAGGDVEMATPFADPIFEGKPAISFAAFGLRQQDADFVKELNTALAKFINSDRHLAIVGEFGFTKDQLPGNKTSAEICEGK